MHLLIPFAAPIDESGRQALGTLALPHLAALLARAAAPRIVAGDELSLSAPHERALAAALGWRGGDGTWPWAARWARADGLEFGSRAVGLLTPAHWHLGTDQVTLLDPDQLELEPADARVLFEAVHGLCLADGGTLHFGAPTRWYLEHPGLAGVATASLDRAIGRNVDRWLGGDPALRPIRRLQSEVQMLLHAHPVNAAREARGQLPVNSFWLSGCGVAQPDGASPPTVDARLRAPALAGDAAAWGEAWRALDAGPLRALAEAARGGAALTLTLCGERSAARVEVPPARAWTALRARLARPDWRGLLESL